MSKAISYIFGGHDYPRVTGVMHFKDTSSGYLQIDADIKGLPGAIHSIHIHEKGVCIDTEIGAFASAGELRMLTPDLPTLLPGGDGGVKMTYYTKKFTVDDIIGCSVIIHEAADNSKRIACGIIRKIIEGRKNYS